MDKLDALLFDAAKHETSQAGFEAAWEDIRRTHNKKKRARRSFMLRCASLAAMLVIGLCAGIFFERTGMLAGPAPSITPLVPPAQANTPAPALPGVEASPTPDSIGVPAPDDSEPISPPTVPPPEIIIEPPKTDPGDIPNVIIDVPKTSGEPYIAPPLPGDGQDVHFPDDRRFPDIPLGGDISTYVPAWLPEGYGEAILYQEGAEWHAATEGTETPGVINAGLVTEAQVDLAYKIGLAKRMGRACTIKTGTDTLTEWIIRVSDDMYLRLWFDNVGYEDAVRIIESMGEGVSQ